MTSKLCKTCGKEIFDITIRVCGTSWDYCKCKKFQPEDDFCYKCVTMKEFCKCKQKKGCVCSVCEEHKCNSKICGCRCHIDKQKGCGKNVPTNRGYPHVCGLDGYLCQSCSPKEKK